MKSKLTCAANITVKYMENAPKQCAIIETICFFSLFDYPLTAFELAVWLKSSVKIAAGDIFRAASKLACEERSPIGFKNGFFFLSGHEESVEHRMQNFLTHLPKYERARRAARLISWVPFLRMVAICNTVAMATANQESDIDFFIVVHGGRLWFVRLLTALVLHCAGLRRHTHHIANRICLSFYTADSALDLSALRLPQGDIYMSYWPTQLVLLLNEDGMYEKFVEANKWVRGVLPQADFESAIRDSRMISRGFAPRAVSRMLEKVFNGRLGDTLERACRCIQRAKMKIAPHGARPVENAVIISDTILKFHERDRRQEFQERWEKQIEKYV